MGINDGDLDVAGCLVRIRGKGRRERLCPVGSYALRAVEHWRKVREVSPKEPSGAMRPLFVNRFGCRLTTRSVARMLEKYLQLTGLDQRTLAPYPATQLRHSPARPRRRHPRRAGVAGAQEPGDDTNLHARQHGRPAGSL